MVEYHIPSAPGGVADIFDQLESNKNALQIKHFSVSQTTLDEVRKKETRHKQRARENYCEVDGMEGLKNGTEDERRR